MERPWGIVDPNSEHQLWSRWTFFVASGDRHPGFADLKHNFAIWARLRFGTAGRARVDEWVKVPIELRRAALAEGVALTKRRRGYSMIVEVDGKPAHDPDFRQVLWRQFVDYVEKGWGPGTYHTMKIKVLAGDQQNGKPSDQLLVLPAALSL